MEDGSIEPHIGELRRHDRFCCWQIMPDQNVPIHRGRMGWAGHVREVPAVWYVPISLERYISAFRDIER